MKGIYLSLITVLVVSSLFFTSCKKDKTNTEVFASITDTTGAEVLGVTYDNDGRVIKATAGTVNYDFYYAEGKLIKRVQSESGSLVATDSFFYDGLDRYARVDNYDNNGTKAKSTVFSYNLNNSIDAVNVNSSTVGTPDAMFEFTYAGTNFNTVKEYEKTLGTFSIKRQYEFLAYDTKTNPIASLIGKYFPDQFNLLILFWGTGNNCTSMRQTDYSVINGDVTGSFPVTATYTYNGNNMPTDVASTINGNTNRSNYHYTTL
jgi:hypothetical protein